MSALKLKLRAAPSRRLDLSPLIPGRLAGLSIAEIEKIAIYAGPEGLTVGDCFAVSGAAGDALHIEGGSDKFDKVGAEHAGGEIIVDGDVGLYAGRRMKSGRLDIRGNAGDCLASNLRGGIVIVSGSAGTHLGGPLAGEKDGLAGGTVVVMGDTGDLAGERMRRGTLVVKGRMGRNAGARMMGGTIIGEQGLSAGAGVQMRRGTLIGPSLEAQSATFVDCGTHELLILTIMAAYWRRTLGDLAPPAIASAPRRLMGDLSSLGKGEILLTEG
ncbi:MAG: formylmethanofuran dehydrogenase subunit C [Alphaproteobacteria bacterium]|nr:formylmethanofuran dehydrogenase subunit C [Alphaproteobacteria bacterium]